MKIVAFNCSPRMKSSNTERILAPLLEGAVAAGAEVETVYVRKLKISTCKGCHSCWFKTPGSCVQDDDWGLALGKMAEADVIVYGTPVHYWHFSAYMKNLMERTALPIILADLEKVDGRLVHRSRYPGISKKSVLVANGMMWGEGIFDALPEVMENGFSRVVDADGNRIMRLVGKILIGCGSLLEWDELGQDLGQFLDELRSAGAELVREGRLSPATEAKLNVPLWSYLGIDEDRALEMLDDHFRLMESEVRVSEVQ
jgi:multimeric flavodoxin WrbA